MAPLEPCPECGATPASALLCEACGRVLEPGRAPTPFEALGVEPRFDLDEVALRKRLLALSRRLHPDFHGTGADADRERAQARTAELNAAHEVLTDPFRRADWLVRRLGGPGEDEERQMPQAFLMEVMEWNEAVEEAREAGPGSPQAAALTDLERELSAARETEMAAVRERLVPLPERGSPALVDVRRHLNAVRYLDRTLNEITELSLESAR